MPEQISDEQYELYKQQQDAAFEELLADPRTKQIAAYVDERTYERIRKLAYEWNMSRSQVIHLAVMQTLLQWQGSHYEQTGRPLFDDDKTS